MSFALLILRAVVGALFIGHGAQKLFGAFDGHGLDATAQLFESLGYRPGRRHALLAGATELGGGSLLALGLLTPLAAAMVIGLMVNAIGAVHGPNGPWVTKGGYEYPLVLIVTMYVVATAGAGIASFDHIAGLGLSGALWGLIGLVVGLGTGAAVLSTRKPEPQEEVEPTPKELEARAGEGRTSVPLTAEEPFELGR